MMVWQKPNSAFVSLVHPPPADETGILADCGSNAPDQKRATTRKHKDLYSHPSSVSGS